MCNGAGWGSGLVRAKSDLVIAKADTKRLIARKRASNEALARPGAREPLLQLQRTHGNRCVQKVLARPDRGESHQSHIARQSLTMPGPTNTSQPPVATQPGTMTPVARPPLSALRTIAQTAINAEYASAARDGLTDFESIVGSDIDEGALITNLAGNIIWATACFTTGVPALAISLAGIAVSTMSPAASTAVDRTALHKFAAEAINAIVKALLKQVDPLTANIDAEAARNDWDDSTTRTHLLQAIFLPEFIQVVPGGTPNVDRAAIARRINIELIIRANAYKHGILKDSGGVVQYDYKMSNFAVTHGFWPFDETTLQPEAQWTFARGGTSLFLEHGGESAFDLLRSEPLLQPAGLPFRKIVYLSGGGGNDIEIWLSSDNQIQSATGYGLFQNLGAEQRRGPSRSPPPAADPIGMARRICALMWAPTGGNPPWVRGQDLLLANFPGRSRATR